jgi:2-octaprenylphenol hydroxylase
MSAPQRYDVIIVGGGMVGLVLAKALADSQFSVAVIESSKNQPSWDTKNFDLRVSAITRASQRIMETLGAWQKIQAMRLSPFRDMHVWDATGDGVIHFDSAEIGESCLGHIIENSAIQTALYCVCQEKENIAWYLGAKPEKLEHKDKGITLFLDDGNSIDASLIVGADGGKSWVRKTAGIEVDSTDYKQTAVVATVKTELQHRETAWQRFLPTGPLAFLPLTDDYCSIVWSTSPQQADALVAMDNDNFCTELATAFDHKLGNVVETSARAKFPLRSQHARHYIKDRLALVGDAAHTIHPLAGQGVNLGFADAAALAEVLVTTRHKKKDIGTYLALRPYERWRKGENLAMLTTMTGFKTLFSNENPFLSTIRNVGLNITDNVSPLKNTIIRHAMGLVGDLPKLARNQIL